jgi:hypothetical protein
MRFKRKAHIGTSAVPQQAMVDAMTNGIMRAAHDLRSRLEETVNETDLVWAHGFLTAVIENLEARSELLRVGLQGLRDAAKFDNGGQR